jgi:hypothetical protein
MMNEGLFVCVCGYTSVLLFWFSVVCLFCLRVLVLHGKAKR